MECKICGRILNGQRGLSSHLRQTHNIKTLLDFKEYYDKYILNEDIMCPICKKHKRKFIAFDYGYASTCIGQKDENGKLLTCRFIWNNKDKEKSSRIQIETIKKLKETPSEIDPSKTKYQIQKDNWYEVMSKENIDGKNKFDEIGEKVSDYLWTKDPVTGKTNAKIIGEKSRTTRLTTILEDGRTIAQHHTKKSAITVVNMIMPDGRTKKEHMTEHAMITRETTILPNGLNICQDVARRAYDTKLKNGTLPKYHGYSKVSESIFVELIRYLHLDFNRCFFGSTEKQFINSNDQVTHRIDFTYVDENNNPIFFIEFQGNQYHLRESELETRKNDINPHGTLLIEGYIRDQTKKQYIETNYPTIQLFYIWEDTIEEDIEKISNSLLLFRTK